MKKLICIACLLNLVSFGSLFAANYYVSTEGSDSNDGSLSSPFLTLTTALTKVTAGDSILIRGGTYSPTATINITISGSSGKVIFIGAYGDEKPVFDYSGCTYSSTDQRNGLRGFFITGSYLYIKGLEIKNAPDNGTKLEGSYCTIEQCVFHHNGDSGLQIGLSSTDTNDGTLARNNFVKNCDAYMNADIWNDGENADGFACKLWPGPGNKFYGCRAWMNSDDGWDLYETEYLIEIDNCWTWDNGNPDNYTGWTTWAGDGNGFKLGGAGAAGGHYIHNSIAFSNKQEYSRGFHQNNNGSGIVVYNCTAWDNTVNFSFNDAVTVTKVHELKNNIAFAFYAHPDQSGASNARLIAGTVSESNTWDTATSATADYSDFVSTSLSDALAARGADGSLPTQFGRLKAGVAVIDKGQDVKLSFSGSAPDLGAYEYEGPVDVKKSSQNVNCFFKAKSLSVSDKLVITGTITQMSKINAAIIDLSGKVLATADFTDCSSGENMLTLNVAAITSGVYLCVINGKSNGSMVTETVMFIKR